MRFTVQGAKHQCRNHVVDARIPPVQRLTKIEQLRKGRWRVRKSEELIRVPRGDPPLHGNEVTPELRNPGPETAYRVRHHFRFGQTDRDIIDVARNSFSATEQGRQGCCAATAERIENYVIRLREPLDPFFRKTLREHGEVWAQ